jgi:hypothetical protein
VIATHDVVLVGADLAGMRATIAAHDEGTDVALVSKLHLTHSHSGAAGRRDQRRARQVVAIDGNARIPQISRTRAAGVPGSTR